jgi:hypothetical protein
MAVKFYQKGSYQVLDGDVERIGSFDLVVEGTVVNIIDRNKETNVWNGEVSNIQDSSGTSIGSTVMIQLLISLVTTSTLTPERTLKSLLRLVVLSTRLPM